MIFLMIISIVLLFLYCSCVVASRVDKEDEVRRNYNNDRKGKKEE